MRYALCSTLAPRLSKDFERDLVDRLGEIGIEGLDGAQAVYFGMDYHFEWIHAALVLASNPELSVCHEGKKEARIEDVDLLVVLKRVNGSVVLVLIEAKGVTSFSRSQFDSKLGRLSELRAAISDRDEWITPIMLLMSPRMPLEASLNEFAAPLRQKNIGFWPEEADQKLVWMELKEFFYDIGGPEKALRIATCYAGGRPAADLAERTSTEYTHWQVVPRFPSKTKP